MNQTSKDKTRKSVSCSDSLRAYGRAYVYVYDSQRKISILFTDSSGDQWRELVSTIDKTVNNFNVKQAKKEKEG